MFSISFTSPLNYFQNILKKYRGEREQLVHAILKVENIAFMLELEQSNHNIKTIVVENV